jgi:hypothetical protein
MDLHLSPFVIHHNSRNPFALSHQFYSFALQEQLEGRIPLCFSRKKVEEVPLSATNLQVTGTCRKSTRSNRESPTITPSDSTVSGDKSAGDVLGQQARFVATDVKVIVLPDTGHWVMEERLHLASACTWQRMRC